MESMSGAERGVASTNPVDPGAQSRDDMSIKERLDEELRRRRPDRLERDVVPVGLPVWLMPAPPPQETPMSLSLAQTPGTSGDGAAWTSLVPDVDNANAADSAAGLRRADAEIAARQAAAEATARRAPKTSIHDTARSPAAQGAGDGGNGHPLTPGDGVDASRADEPLALQRDTGLTDRPGGQASSPADALTVREAAPAMGGDARRHARNGHGDGGASGMPAIVQGAPPNRPAQRAPAPSSHGDAARASGRNASSHAAQADVRPPGSGDSMRYAFGSWGKGHFVNVQVMQVEGRRHFLLGASDAIVQRRLASALPASGDIATPRGMSDAGVRVVEAVPGSGENPDEE
ncbi:SpaN/EivJ family type III secretion system needle length determinant [Pandoraea anhela]|uniref:Surface presentation of antigen domain-containing protein n=1 Tax=Pandoraea anhela TaxID=2508295 RepID=A0A5E4SR00_9BURK|nr:hypothetical protein [Pandoraea anhela]VVD77323.1 hypothetical protein PAN31108_00925 [Pandoraea anhela]